MSQSIEELIGEIAAGYISKKCQPLVPSAIPVPFPKVLVVDDDHNTCFLVTRQLEKFGVEVVCFDDGKGAIQYVKDRGEDLIFAFVDLKLPGASGPEVMQSIKDACPKLHIIVISGYPRSEEMIQAARVGYIGFIEKPLTEDNVRQIFTSHHLILPDKKDFLNAS